MKKVLILVEGQTEETVVGQVMNPHLAPSGIYLDPVILRTKREKSGRTFKGGITSFAHVERDLRALLGDSSAVAVSTLIDYYGLPNDFPGLSNRPVGRSIERIAHVEKAFADTIDNRRFIPHLTLHEIEAWVFVELSKCDWVLDGKMTVDRLAAIRDECGGAEEINENPKTAPSKRILSLIADYQKPLQGAIAIGEIGMGAIRAACPHADAWLRKIEALGAGLAETLAET